MNSSKFNKLLKRYRYDRSAVKRLYEFYYPLIVIHIDCRFSGAVEGRDIAQQFFLKLFTIERPEKIRYPTAWVYTSVRNLAIETIRKEKKRKAAEKTATLPDKDYLEENYQEVLECLDEKEKMVIYLHYWELYQFKEIADLLNLKYDAVKYLHKKAKQKLRKSLKGKNKNEKE